MRIVIDPVSVDAGAARLFDVASELAQLETRLRSVPLPAMPATTAARVGAAVDHAAATLRSLVIDYVSIGQELRMRSTAIRSDALSWLTPTAQVPVWFAGWFRDEIVKGGVAPFSAAFVRDAAIGRLSYIMRKHPDDILRWFTDIHAVTGRKRAALERSKRLLDLLIDPLVRDAITVRIGERAAQIRRLRALRSMWLRRIRGVGHLGVFYGVVSDAMHSEANTKWGKALSSGFNFAFTRSPAGTSIDLVTGGGLSSSADFYAITAETLIDPDLGNYQEWTDANLRGDNGWLFRVAAQIPENGEYLADYTYEKWTWFPVDEKTGETRFEWRPWKWDD